MLPEDFQARPCVFSIGALCAEPHIGINFNRLVHFNLHPSVLDIAVWRQRSGPAVVLDNYNDTGKRKQGAGEQ